MVKISFNLGLIIPSVRVFLEIVFVSSVISKSESFSLSSSSLFSDLFLSSSWFSYFFIFPDKANLIFSEDSKESLKPMAISLVTFLAPIGKTTL